MFETIFNILLLVVGVAVVAGVIWWYLKTGDRERFAEDDARAFHEEHGRWPDQTPDEAAQERARVAAAFEVAHAPVSRASDDGSV